MNHRLALWLMPIVLFLTVPMAMGDEAPAPRPIESVQVTVPTGAYALVTLDFSVNDAHELFQNWRYMGGMRAGRMNIDHGIGIREPGGHLELKDGRLTGTFVRIHGRRNVVEQRVTVDATVRDGGIEGRATIGRATGTVTGRIVEETELAANNRIDPEKRWPSFLGPAGRGTAAQSTGVATIESADRIELRWRSEEIDIGQGIGSISRFMHTWRDANGMRTASGSSSPVAGDGMVFLSYFVPSPTEREVPHRWFDGVGHDDPASARQRLAEQSGLAESDLPAHAMEKQWVAADDVVLAMDAATGKTVWKAVMRDRGLSIQHHKIGPFNMTPAHGEGRVFAIGMSGWLYAFEARTGKPLWETNLQLGRGPMFSSSVVAARGVVVAPRGGFWTGFDPATGRQLWRSQLRHSQVSLALWTSGDTDYLLGSAGSSIVCLNPRTGEVVWELELPAEPDRVATVRSAGRGMGSGGISVHGDTLLAYVDDVDARAQSNAERNASRRTHCMAWSLKLDSQPRLRWKQPVETLHGGNVPVVVHGRFVFTVDLQLLELSDGQIAARGTGTRPGNGGYLQAIEDLVLVRRDGTHGNIQTCIYRVSPEGKITNLTPERDWSPTFGGGTTSYHHPIMYPLVDGRMFLRQFDGVYCWDLRHGE